MPWNIVKRGGKYCVIKRGTDEVEGCHSTPGKAQAQQRALYASEKQSASHEDIVRALEELDAVLVAKNANYRRSVRNAFRNAWNGNYKVSEFIIFMESSIRSWFTRGFVQGAKQCGVKYADLTSKQRKVLAERIAIESETLESIYKWITADIGGNRRRLNEIYSRAEVWVRRYNELEDLGAIHVCGDDIWQWILNPEKESCRSCLHLNGKKYRGSQWAEAGVYPRSRALACKGIHCGCRMKKAKGPVSQGRPKYV